VAQRARRLQVAEKDQQVEAEKELQEVDKVIERETRGEQLAALVGAAVAFGAGVWYVQGPEKAQEYFAGYLLEQSLSIDNLFVFILVFNYFRTPPDLQTKVLTYGLATAAVLRAVMIIVGVELIEQFEPLLLLFAAILLYSSFRLLADSEDGDEDLSKNSLVQFCQKLIPVSTKYDGSNFFTVDNGVRMATPLLLVLAIIELSDVVFAVDSIPAVFGVTLDPFIVYSSNIFAIISLRSLYSFVSSMMTDLRFLDKAVAIVLGFIGVKMIGDFAGLKIPTDVALLVVASVLGGGIGLSLLLPEPTEGDM
jgi:TerC family integral membrane protein